MPKGIVEQFYRTKIMETEQNGSSSNSNSKTIGVKDIEFYYNEMIRSNLVELEVESNGVKIVLKRSHLERELMSTGAMGAVLPFRRRRTDFMPDEKYESSMPVDTNLKTISTPITGVFYRSSSPQSPPFVKEGETVNASSTLCIVEAMKVMNEIKAEMQCKIIKILVENGKPVTLGQGLFEVEPS